MVARPLDRRQRRRQETIEEVLDVALEVMTEQGVAGLSIGEVARRMGIRPPSLYVYFDSKNALYDALFERGAHDALRTAEEAYARAATGKTAEAILLPTARAFVQWSLQNSVYSQLLFWRPVPGYHPSPQAYAPALRLVDRMRDRFTDLAQRGLLRANTPVDQIVRDWTVIITGVITQQLANDPDASFDDGEFTRALPGLVAMFAGRYGTPDRKRRVHGANKS